VRKEVVLAALVFVILATAATLWRSRWAVTLVVAICVAATGLGLRWRSRQSPCIEAGGSIIVLTANTTQRDDWVCRGVLRESAGSFPFQSLTRPVFGTRRQAEELNATQVCRSDAMPVEFHYRLEPGETLAFQTRHLASSREDIPLINPIISPLRTMADQLYAMKDDKLIGQVDGGDEASWPDVLVQRTAVPIIPEKH
jgi:hypothetical protein